MKKMILVLLLVSVVIAGCKKAEAPAAPEAPVAPAAPATPAK